MNVQQTNIRKSKSDYTLIATTTCYTIFRIQLFTPVRI